MMGALLMEYARRHGVEKFVGDRDGVLPTRSTRRCRSARTISGTAIPEETNAPYGMAKKMLLVQAQAYREQYGFNAIFLLPVNLYGPGDNFDPSTSHVIPALIRKCVEAREAGADEVVGLGLGQGHARVPLRRGRRGGDRAGRRALRRRRAREHRRRLRDLDPGPRRSIAALTGFQGRIVWDASKPDGQPRRWLDTSRAAREFGFRATTPFEEGLDARSSGTGPPGSEHCAARRHSACGASGLSRSSSVPLFSAPILSNRDTAFCLWGHLGMGAISLPTLRWRGPTPMPSDRG